MRQGIAIAAAVLAAAIAVFAFIRLASKDGAPVDAPLAQGDAVTLPDICREILFERARVIACDVDPAADEIRIVHSGSDGAPYGSVPAFAAAVQGAAAPDRDELQVLRAGLDAADRWTTVSSTYARRLLDGREGAALREAFDAHRDALTAIECGVDASTWSPTTDVHLPCRFDPIDRRGKGRCKGALQQAMSLPVRADVPLVGVVATGPADRTIEVFAEIARKVLRNDVQVVVQIDAAEPAERVAVLEALGDRWPDRLQVRRGSAEATTHLIIAASDLLLVLADAADGVALQLRGQRYGAVPVVPADSALSDAIVDCDASLRTGTGFVADDAGPDAVLAAVRRGLAAFTNGAAFGGLQGRVMGLDSSWERSARRYEHVYRVALAEHAAQSA